MKSCLEFLYLNLSAFIILLKSLLSFSSSGVISKSAIRLDDVLELGVEVTFLTAFLAGTSLNLDNLKNYKSSSSYFLSSALISVVLGVDSFLALVTLGLGETSLNLFPIILLNSASRDSSLALGCKALLVY
jgi:hypothetical protein